MKGLLVTAVAVAVFALACGEEEEPSPSGPPMSATATATEPPTMSASTAPIPVTPPADLLDRIRACVAGMQSASDAAAALNSCLTTDTVQANAATADGSTELVLLDILSKPRCFFTESFVLSKEGADWNTQSLEPVISSPDQGTAFASGSLSWPPSERGVRARVVAGAEQSLDLGIIFGEAGCGSGPHDAFALLSFTGGEWRLRWDSRDSDMATLAHTEIVFRGEGLEGLDVSGDSWTQGDTKGRIFHESNPGPHRYFEQTWVRQGYEFVLLEESVVPSAYNTLVEFIYRLSTGDQQGAGQLAADASLVERARQLGLVQEPPGRQWLTNLDNDTVCCGPIFILEGPPQETQVTFTDASGEWLISGIQATDYPGYP